MNRLNFGVVGVGEMGKRHADNQRWNTPGAILTAVADANYYRTRPAPRPTLASWHRREAVPTEVADVPAPPRAKVVATASVPPIDDGGIWRPKSVIDLSSVRSAVDDEPEAIDERFDHPERLPLFRGFDGPGNGSAK